MATFNCIVTNAGRQLLATASTGGQTINLVNVKTGNGQIGAGDAYNLTSLINDIQDYSIDGSNSLTPYQTSVQFTVNSANVVTQYQMYEVGLMAQIGINTPVLLWYGYTATPDTITPSGSSNATIDVNQLAIVYTEATTCVATQTPTVTVPPHAVTHIQDSSNSSSGFDPIPVSTTTSTGLLTRLSGLITDVFRGNGTWSNLAALVNAIVFPHAAKHLDNGSDAIPYPSTTRSGVVLANPNDVTKVYCGSNPPSWQPTLLRINQNVTLYVSINGNDASALSYLASNFPTIPNNVSSPFLTIQAAINWLVSYYIPVGFTVTISVSAGVYSVSSPISIKHPNGAQINIIGTLGPVVTGTSSYNSGNVVTILGAFTGINTGDWVLVEGTSSTGDVAVSGFFPVAAASATAIQYNVIVDAPVSGVFGVYKLATLISGVPGQSCVTIAGDLGLFQNIGILGTQSGATAIVGFSCTSGSVNVNRCGVYGFLDSGANSSGFVITYSGILNISNSNATTCNNGFQSSNGPCSINATNCIAKACTIGFRNGGSYIQLNQCYSVGNTQGVNVSSAGLGTMYGCGIWYNTYGLVSQYSSGIFIGGLVSTNGALNSLDVDLYSRSAIARVGGPAFIYSTTNATPNVLTADGSLFNP